MGIWMSSRKVKAVIRWARKARPSTAARSALKTPLHARFFRDVIIGHVAVSTVYTRRKVSTVACYQFWPLDIVRPCPYHVPARCCNTYNILQAILHMHRHGLAVASILGFQKS